MQIIALDMLYPLTKQTQSGAACNHKLASVNKHYFSGNNKYRRHTEICKMFLEDSHHETNELCLHNPALLVLVVNKALTVDRLPVVDTQHMIANACRQELNEMHLCF